MRNGASQPDARYVEDGAFASAHRYGPDPALSPSRLEARALELARRRLTPPPRTSGVLSRAARELAARAAARDPDPLGPAALRGALARALAADPAPAAILVTASAEEAAGAAARALAGDGSHLGVGAVERDGVAWVVLLLSHRRVRIDPFPREVGAGGRAILSGELAAASSGARVFVTRPSGAVEEVGAGAGRAFRVPVAFPQPGRHVLEVIATGAGGPEVVALLTVAAGPGTPLDAPPRAPPPADPADRTAAERAVLDAINATRRAHGLPQVSASPALAEAARRHSEAMAAARRVAHVVAGSGEVAERLRRAGVPFQIALENVGRAGSSLAAHRAIEESPAHRANLLAPAATAAGVGIARARLPSGEASIYVTEILVAPPDDGAESRLTPDGRVCEALWRERERLGVAPLTRDPALDAVAREVAQALRARDDTDPDGASERALAKGRKLAAADVFVAGGPDEATRSSNLRDARFRRVGVGVAAGESARFGKGRLWIVVVYSD